MFHSIAFFLWESIMFFNTPKNYGGILWKMQHPFKRNPPLQAGYIPVPYVACFSIYSRLFNMQNSCQTVQYPMHQSNIPWKSCKAKMTMLLAHSNFPIRLHSILVKKPCSWKKKLDTWNIPVEKAQSSLFVVSNNPLTFWGTISFIQYERLVLSS
jgi:hypothetical protein